LTNPAWALLLVFVGPLMPGPQVSLAAERAIEPLDPAAWGSDHVGHPLPQFVTGDECLFCHRDVGPSWGDNRHNLTVQPATPLSAAIKALRSGPEFAGLTDQVELLLGRERRVRYLKRADQYGKLDLLTVAYVPRDAAQGELVDAADPQWERDTFADRCAGCHTTAVETKAGAFAAVSLDCVTCHGDVPLAHSNDVSLVHFSEKNREAREVVSICGQCHLRGGKSRSTGRPYPNQFVAGDNLFRDFQIEWEGATIERMSPGERHVFQNVRDVALLGKLDVTCLSCHNVHAQTAENHTELARSALCAVCHAGSEAVASLPSIEAHNDICGY
jgi:predicted CXXCH cytochrome family protein